ncbi:MAG: hypothetical protein WCO93_07035 [bacterium]
MNEFSRPLVTPPENPGIRFYAGMTLFIASFFMLPIGLVLKGFAVSHFWKAFILTCFWVSAPLMKISSIAIMGKTTYMWIKYKMHYVYHRFTRSRDVSRIRYNIGLVMFVLPFIPNYIISYTPHLLPTSMKFHYITIISADVIFLASLFILGGDFWDKLRALFVYSAKAQFEQDK